MNFYFIRFSKCIREGFRGMVRDSVDVEVKNKVFDYR